MNQVGCIALSEHPKVFSNQLLKEDTNLLGNSRYCYRDNKNIDDLYIFEIILEGFNDNNTNFRKITRERSGSLIHLEDSILYNDIKKIELSALDVNKPCNEVHINYKLNHDNNKNIIIDNNICIEFKKIDNLLKCNFNFIKI
jgi:hypothetical protein